MSLLEKVKITKVLAGSTVASTAAAPSACVDMSGYDGVMFLGTFITSGAGHLLKAQKCATSTGGTPIDLTNATVTAINGGETAVVDVVKPRQGHRYIRADYIKAAVASGFGDVYAVRYLGKKKPTVNSSDVDSGIVSVVAISPST